MEPQSLAFLTEVGLDTSTHPVLVAQLDRIIGRLLEALPRTLAEWRRGVDFRHLKDIRIDHLGSVGTRLMLERVRIPSPDEEFVARASATFPRGPSGDFSRCRSGAPSIADNVPQQRRIFAYAEYVFHTQGSPETEHVRGRMLREHGFQGLRMWQKGWLRAITLPVNMSVDRSVCAEFQVLNELCDLAHQQGLADSMDDCCLVHGSVKVLVSTTPCLSCVCAVLQYTALFPKLFVEFGCVQPWHAAGGSDGALSEPVWTGSGQERLLPAMWEGGRIVPPQGQLRGDHSREASVELATPAAEPLEPRALETLQAACQAKLGGGRSASVDLGQATTWEELKAALQLCSPNDLADVLRGHRHAVRAETQPERVEKVLALLRSIQKNSKEDTGRPESAPTPRGPHPGHTSLTSRRGPSKSPAARWRAGT